MNVAQHWRLNEQRYQMSGMVNDGGEVVFPPRPEVSQRTEVQYELTKEETNRRTVAEVSMQFADVA